MVWWVYALTASIGEYGVCLWQAVIVYFHLFCLDVLVCVYSSHLLSPVGCSAGRWLVTHVAVLFSHLPLLLIISLFACFLSPLSLRSLRLVIVVVICNFHSHVFYQSGEQTI